MPDFFVTYLRFPLFLLSLLLLCGQSCATTPITPPTQKPYIINNQKYYPIPSSAGFVENGIASWYGPDFHGRPTSNGERYDMHGPTAAHKLLPMNTMLLVKNLENGREAIVRINDRGPFVRGRIIDLSYSIAKTLGIIRKGTAKVQIVALAPQNGGNNINLQVALNTGEFYVQIGSFIQKNNALRMQKKFAEFGHTAVIKKYTSPKAVYYRVQVYAGTHLHHARRAEAALLKNGYKGAFIVAR